MRLLTIAALAVWLGAAAMAQEGCDAGVAVEGAEAPLAAEICAILSDQRRRAEACGMARPDAVTVSVVPEMRASLHQCLGAYLCDEYRIEILSPDALEDRHGSLAEFGGLTADELFGSILRHEFTHAAIMQTLSGRQITAAGHEYIAYALQIDALATEERARFFEGFELEGPTLQDVFQPMMIALAPRYFSARVWDHFSKPANGCGFVADILSERVVLGGAPG